MALNSEKIIDYVQKILLRCESDMDGTLLYKGGQEYDELDYIVCAVCLLGRSSKTSFTVPVELFGDVSIKKQIRSVRALLRYRKLVE